MAEKILCIFVDKDTQEYDHYEAYPLCEKITKENLVDEVNKFNSNNENKTTVKIYDDPLLAEFVEDALSSRSIDNLIQNLRSICRDIDSSVEDLESWSENIADLIKEKDKEDVNFSIEKGVVG